MPFPVKDPQSTGFAEQVAKRLRDANFDVIGELVSLYRSEGPINGARMRILFTFLRYLENAAGAPSAPVRPVPQPAIKAPPTPSAGTDVVTYH